MDPKPASSEEVVAATDAIFEQQPILPEEQPAAPSYATAAAGPPVPVENPLPDPDQPANLDSPLEDPARELQREYEDQLDEGKI